MQALACSFSVPETEICIQPLSQVRGFSFGYFYLLSVDLKYCQRRLTSSRSATAQLHVDIKSELVL